MRALSICLLSTVASAQVVAPSPAPAAVAAPKRTPVHIAALSLSAAAAILVGSGVIVLGTVDSGFQDLQNTCSLRPCVPADWASLQTRANAGYAIIGIAGAVAVADAVLWYLDSRKPPPSRRARITPLGVTF
jgi:hypothetical protein